MPRHHLAAVIMVAASLSIVACQEPSAEQPADPAAASVPLNVVMRGLATDMARVYEGVWAEAYDSIAASALSVADHPKVGPEQRAAIAGALGEDFRRFAAHDKEVHDAALVVHQAALAQDMERVLRGLDRVQRGCVSCHAGFRERVQPALGTRP